MWHRFCQACYNSGMKKFAIVLISLLIGCSDDNRMDVSINGEKWNVEIARTAVEQQKGLSGRAKLSPRTGMIFLDDDEHIWTMWMLDTRIPLDMIFFNKDWIVVHIERGAVPYDLTHISSVYPAIGVLEINSGEADKVMIGNQIIKN